MDGVHIGKPATTYSVSEVEKELKFLGCFSANTDQRSFLERIKLVWLALDRPTFLLQKLCYIPYNELSGQPFNYANRRNKNSHFLQHQSYAAPTAASNHFQIQ